MELDIIITLKRCKNYKHFILTNFKYISFRNNPHSLYKLKIYILDFV